MRFEESKYIVDLPEPTIYKTIDFEKILAEIIADFVAREPEYNEVVLESDPIKKVFEAWAYDRMIRNNEYNEDLKQTLLKYATGDNLDAIAANVLIYRRLIQPEDNTTNPPTPAIWEDDESLRYRAQTADRLEQTAGPKSAYERLALEASEEVKESTVLLPTPKPGEVHVVIRSKENNGQASAELLKQVKEYLSAEDKRPLNDIVIVKKATLVKVDIELIATYYNGYAKEEVAKNVQEALLKLNERMTFGDSLTYNLIHATARIPGIQNIEIVKPKSDVDIDQSSYIMINSVKVTEKQEEE